MPRIINGYRVAVAIVILLSLPHFSFAQWQWTKTFGNYGYDYATAMKTDSHGNIYVGGDFIATTITFGSIRLYQSTAVAGTEAFVVKFDQSGRALWAKSAKGWNGNDYVRSLAVDAQGSVYVAGVFGSDSITFGAITIRNAASATGAGMFIVKYDSSGNVQWAKSCGGSGVDKMCGIDVDALGNCYVTGTIAGASARFDATVINNSSGIGSDFFLAKYTTNGVLTWAKGFGGAKYDAANAIAATSQGETYVTGSFTSDSINFGSAVARHIAVTSDIFLVKFDSSGRAIWASAYGGASTDQGTAIVIDKVGDVYLGGDYISPALGIGSSMLANTGSKNAFVAKFTTAGVYIWSQTANCSDISYLNSFAVDSYNSIYLAGAFSGATLTLGGQSLTGSSGFNRLYVAQFHSNGVCARIDGVSQGVGCEAKCISADHLGNVYVSGSYTVGGTPIVIGADTLYGSGNNDIFLSKLRGVPSATTTVADAHRGAFAIFPNPAYSVIHIEAMEAVGSFVITDLLGSQVYSAECTGKSIDINIEKLAAGIYLVKLGSGSFGRFVKE